MKKAWFVTGTDTGVGKTAVTASIAHGFSQLGLRVGVMKPVETGCRPLKEEGRDDLLECSDAMTLKEAASSTSPLELINPYSFGPPISPELAARNVGIEIDFEVIGASFKKIKRTSDVILVEGAGGLLVPLADGTGSKGGGEAMVKVGRGEAEAGQSTTMADLASFLGLPIIIVAPSRIGVINHSMLTVRLARYMGLTVSGIVLNHPALPDHSDRSLAYNKTEITRHTGVPVLGEVPYVEKNAPYVDVRSVITALLGENL